MYFNTIFFKDDLDVNEVDMPKYMSKETFDEGRYVCSHT